MKFRFCEPPRETKIGSRNWATLKIEGEKVLFEGERLLVRVVDRKFRKKYRIREIRNTI